MTRTARPALVVYGAGNIGRGIVSLLFSRAGYRLLFYRRDRTALLDMQARGGYAVRLQGGAPEESVPIVDFGVLTDREALLDALTDCDLAACCLYPAAFAQAAETLAEACRRRAVPLNVLLCCNEPKGAELLRRAAEQALPPEERSGALSRLRVIPSIVYSAGFPSPDGGPYDVTVSANGYIEAERGAFSGSVPQVPGLRPVDGVNARLCRKLYLGNLFHTYAALLGAERGYETMAQCYADPELRRLVEEAFSQSEDALLSAWSFDPEEHLRWRTMMLDKMDHPSGDRIERVLRDLPRKLRREDRLTGPALLCVRQGLPCGRLADAAALALERLGREQPDFGRALRNDPAAAVGTACGLSAGDAAQQTLIEQIVRRLRQRRSEC